MPDIDSPATHRYADDDRYFGPIPIPATSIRAIQAAAEASANAGTVPVIALPNEGAYMAASFVVPPKWATYDIVVRYCNGDAAAAGTCRLWAGLLDFGVGDTMNTGTTSWTDYFDVSGTHDLVQEATVSEDLIATPGALVTYFAGRETGQGTYAGVVEVLAIVAVPTSFIP